MRLLVLLIAVVVLVMMYFLWMEDFLLLDKSRYRQLNQQLNQTQEQVGDYKETKIEVEQKIMRELDKIDQ